MIGQFSRCPSVFPPRYFHIFIVAFIAASCVSHSVCAPRSVIAEDWPKFLGPDGTSVSAESGLPDKWDSKTNVRWKQPITGRGWSSPIVVGNKVIVTTAISQQQLEAPKKGLYFGGNRKRPRAASHSWQVIAFDKLSGDQLWATECSSGTPTNAIHLKNSYASETPISDGEHVYAFFGSCGVYCLDLDGNKVWDKNPGQFETRDGWGTSSSPVVDDKRVYVQWLNDEQSFVVAYNKKSGDEVWRKELTEKSAWGSPVLWKNSLRTELVIAASGFARSLDPESGKLLWKLGGHSSIVCPTPIIGDDLLYLASGYVGDRNRPIYAVKPGGEGDITPKEKKNNPFVAWHQSKVGPYNPSPVLYKGQLYVLLDRGFLGSYDAATGEATNRTARIDGSRAGFTTTPWAYDGKIFCLDEDGVCFVFETGNGLKQLHRNKLDEMCMASPAISDRQLFIRTKKHLYAIAKPPARVAEKE